MAVQDTQATNYSNGSLSNCTFRLAVETQRRSSGSSAEESFISLFALEYYPLRRRCQAEGALIALEYRFFREFCPKRFK